MNQKEKIVTKEFTREKNISPFEHCPDCLKDKRIFCPRDVDVKCLICGKNFCGGHIGRHLRKVHCVALDFKHCRR